MWFASPVPPRTWHLSNVSMEHTNLPGLYPHVRVTGYEPPRSYRHMWTTIHEPTRSWHNISRSKCSIIAQTTHKTKQRTSTFSPDSAHTPPSESAPDRLAVPTHRQVPMPFQRHCFLVTAWRSTPCRQTLRNTGTPDASPIAWHTYLCRQALYQ